MKRRDLLKTTALALGAGVTLYLPLGWVAPARAAAKWRIGFSQATTLEPWRVQFNKDIKAEAEKHPDVELLIADAEDKTEKQVADVENFIRQEVNALLISPKESAGLTGVVEKAIEAKIPVIVLDRNVDTQGYTQFIGGDNVVIGKAVGDFVVKTLGGAGQGGRATWSRSGAASAPRPRTTGPTASTRSPTRSRAEVPARQAVGRLEAGPGLRHHGDGPAQPSRRSTWSTATTTRWPMAPISPPRMPAARRRSSSSASTACRTRAWSGSTRASWRRPSSIPTPGAEGLRQAVKLLKGEKVEKTIVLPTETITKENAPEILKRNGLM